MLINSRSYVKADGWFYKVCTSCKHEKLLSKFPFRKIDAKRIYMGKDKRTVEQLRGPSVSHQCNTCIQDKFKNRKIVLDKLVQNEVI